MEFLFSTLAPIVAGAAVMALRAVGELSNTQGLLRRLIEHLSRRDSDKPAATFGERVDRLKAVLTAASAEVDQALAEVTTVVRDRERKLKEAEAVLEGLTQQETALRNKVATLSSLDEEQVRRITELLSPGEKRAAIRDYVLFGGGIVFSVVTSLGFKYMGWV
jgi:hypothetical protein